MTKMIEDCMWTPIFSVFIILTVILSVYKDIHNFLFLKRQNITSIHAILSTKMFLFSKHKHNVGFYVDNSLILFIIVWFVSASLNDILFSFGYFLNALALLWLASSQNIKL